MSEMLEEEIKNIALELGFDLVGIASTNDPSLNLAISRYSEWLDAGHGASMEYLERHKEIKANPNLFLPEAKSVICVALLYAQETLPSQGDQAQVSLYTRGVDYHEVIDEKMASLSERIKERFNIN